MKEKIEGRIAALTSEQRMLEVAHNQMVKRNHKLNEEFQQEVTKNQTRFAQISGGIHELQQLLQGENNEPINVNRSYTSTSGNSDRFPGHHFNISSDVRNPVGDRIVDQPDSASG
jgi:hypothetical protein